LTDTVSQAEHSDKTPQQAAPETRRGFLSREELIERVRSYDPNADADMIGRAYDFARERHGDQTRASGDPYYGHPVQVAEILTELRLDPASVMTGLLHDTVEDTETTLEEISETFSQEVSDLVDGVTKLTQLELTSVHTKQAENLQKFVLAISNDVRVLLVKLADRLHNMRTLHFISKEDKRERIALETIEIYAPLARRIGVDWVCSELEVLAFRHINPGAYESITRRLAALRNEVAHKIGAISQELTGLLEAEGLETRIYGREKSPYSIWRKLQRKEVELEELADIYAFRLIVEDEASCYRALGLIHQRWRCVSDRFRDFISVPKPNNYRSLHTTIIGPDQMRVELQIRTEAMDAVAERGVAAHWRYKDDVYRFDAEAAKQAGGDPLERLRPFVEILEHGGDPEEFLEHAKLEMFADQVFAFTPRGKLINLPIGAMPLDFAYAIHTDLGDKAVGARINGRERPMDTRLRNGDMVEILTAETPAPFPGWEQLIVTGRARSAIRRLVRVSQKEEFVNLGKAVVGSVLRRQGKNPDKISLDDALKRLEMNSVDDLYEALGRNRLTGTDLLNAIFPGRKDSPLNPLRRRWFLKEEKAQFFVRSKNKALTPGVTLHFAKCCSPLPGDRIVGILQPERGVEVHTINCDALADYDGDKDRWIDLDWRPEAEKATAMGVVMLRLVHEPGVLAEIAQLVSENNGNISDVSTLERSTDFFTMRLGIEVRDAKHLSHIIAALRANASVVEAKRAQEARR